MHRKTFCVHASALHSHSGATAQRTVAALDVFPVEKQHVELDVEVERAPEALHRRVRAVLRNNPALLTR